MVEKAHGLIERLSSNIASQRRALGFTQAELAEQLGVDTESISRFERGKHLPSLATLEKLAGLLQVTVAALLNENALAPTDDALLLTSWMNGLAPDDRTFVINQFKNTCTHLKQGK